jgi:hypothetical protein
MQEEIMSNNENEGNRSKPLYLGKIPLIALIFPPIGLIMFIQYLLNKKGKGRILNG